MQFAALDRLSSAHQQKSRDKKLEKVVKKVGIVRLLKYIIHYNELFEISNFRLNEQNNTCDNSTSQTVRLLC